MQTGLLKRGRHESFKTREDPYYKNKRLDLERKGRLQAVSAGDWARHIRWLPGIREILLELNLFGDFLENETL